MSTGKNFEKICVVITVIAVLITVLFMNGSTLGIVADDSVSYGYEDTLFDDSYVHTIDITIDDWDGFLENATSEEYTGADVTIDGEKVKNVGLRAKGNTSLSTVKQLDSDRYSFKIEFDAYNSTGNYHGLDKLCLNNLIQDYTMMKDYIAYKLMGEFGVAAPLVSYSYVTVNGEDWGLYLAVEAVEDSFLQRNYGMEYGDLYKPDSMAMGGGRGNGKGFDMRDMDFDKMGMDNPFNRSSSGNSAGRAPGSGVSGNRPDFPGGGFSGGGGFDGPPDFSEKEGFDGPPDFGGGSASGNRSGSRRGSVSGNRSGFGKGSMSGNRSGFPGGGGGFPGMGGDAAKLKYTDDDVDSYSVIFDSAKTNVKQSDKKRLIRSLKSLSEGIESSDQELIEEAVNVDEVMRYMVVHNFVVNGDSYTGGMIHNYYLYEEDGLMSMIPWDYNLAFGTFQGGDATGSVNDPIDTPLSVTDGDSDRPMFAWITSAEEYKTLYHQYYQEFLERFYASGVLTEWIDNTSEMLHDYVEKDPTKFCTMEQYEEAVKTMRDFVTLRCESIEGQLDGTIPSTDAGQEEDDSSLIDASSLTLSSMGSMGGGRGGGGGGPFGSSGDETKNGEDSDQTSVSGNMPEGFGDMPEGMNPPEGFGDSQGDFGAPPEGFGDTSKGTSAPGGFQGPPGGMTGSFSSVSPSDYIYAGICAAAMLAALLFAVFFRRRRFH